MRRQIDECLRWAEAHNVTVAETYVDNDISATSGKRRPEYERMIADVKEFRRDGVIAWHLDQLHRNPIELEQFIVLIEATGADSRTVTEGDYDLSTSDGRAMARVVGSLAHACAPPSSRDSFAPYDVAKRLCLLRDPNSAIATNQNLCPTTAHF